MRSLRLAVGLLTVVPVGGPQPDARTARRSMLWAPVAGLVAGAPSLLLLMVASGPPLVVAALAVGVLAVTTGALHWDGLADTADGFAVPTGRDDRLAVMRRPDIGPVGVLTTCLTLLLQVVALGSLVAADQAAGGWLLTVVVSRAALPLACIRGTPVARPTGLGALVIGRVPRAAAAALVAVVVAGGGGGLTVATPVRGGLAALAGFGVALLVRFAAIRRFGGLTGDVLGAVVEISAAACLIALCIQW
jgi:adenosylcobinamide-GDP ribazoletransferase